MKYSLKYSLQNVFAVLALAFTASPSITSQPAWVPHLQARGVQVSAGVWDLATGKIIDGYQPELALIPASTTKVVSTYAILKTLKPDYQLETTVWGDLQQGAVRGDLVVKGGGDPFLTNEHIWNLARQVKLRGISRVSGRLRLDQGAWDSQRYGAGWENTSSNTTPPILPLSVNFNRDKNGNISRNPEKLAMDVFTEIFGDVGISFAGQEDNGIEKKLIASYKSPTLHVLTNSVNKISNNFIAEMLVKNFGGGSWASGVARVQEFYKDNLNLTQEEVRITDGSGLSKLNRLSARTLSTILRAAWHDFEVGPEFVSSLKYIGAEPYESRIKDPNLTRRVRCKTGHLDNVDTMCGYIHMPDGNVRVFAILLNGPCTGPDVDYILKLWAN